MSKFMMVDDPQNHKDKYEELPNKVLVYFPKTNEYHMMMIEEVTHFKVKMRLIDKDFIHGYAKADVVILGSSITKKEIKTITSRYEKARMALENYLRKNRIDR